ncbi:MAG: NADH-quinone oxidoreductase subunit H [Dehalococcoidales bacterium]|nr:NADH-quinone oxidoreductase subunit H [Dehalococcoidales bacterium]
MSFILYCVLNTAFILLISPLLMSLIKKVKAYTQGRKGPPLLQTYYSLGKLLRKETIYSSNSSLIMRITPFINVTFLLVASLSIPVVFIPPPVAGVGNIILFLYLMVCAKFFMALAGLDAGSTFGGMGSSREMTFSAIIEPVTIVTFAALGLVLKTINLHEMFAATLIAPAITNPPLLLITLSLFIILIVETSRIPVDNPETHLELTMIHEAMLLEYTGPNLALMETSHAIKQTLLLGIIINIVSPWGLATAPSAGGILLATVMFLVKAGIVAVIIGLFESQVAKSRLFRLPGLFILAFFFSFLTVVFELLS